MNVRPHASTFQRAVRALAACTFFVQAIGVVAETGMSRMAPTGKHWAMVELRRDDP